MSSFAKMLTGFGIMLLASASAAQIYESRDADGNPVFSDEPTQNAQVITVEPTNTAQAPPDIPAAPQETRSAPNIVIVNSQPQAELNEGREVILDDDEYDNRRRIDPRVDAVRRGDVETGLVDDSGQLIAPKADLPREPVTVHPQSKHQPRRD